LTEEGEAYRQNVGQKLSKGGPIRRQKKSMHLRVFPVSYKRMRTGEEKTTTKEKSERWMT